MKKFLRLVLFSALLIGGFNLNAQTPDIRVDRDSDFTLVKVLNSYHWPYDISNNKEHIAIQGFGATDSYYWSEATGALALSGYAFAISDDGTMAGSYTNDLGMNVAGLWSPETKTWEFLGMNPDAPEFSTVEGDFEYNGAWTMTNDGSKVAVMQVFPDWTTTSYLWTNEDGYVQLAQGKSPGTRPNAISDDGRVIVGHAVHEDKGEWTPCYWLDGEIQRFPHHFGEALNVSPNGNYISGYLLTGNAFIYDITNQKLVEIENILEMGNSLSATCVTNNGTVFGYSDGGSPTFRKAFAYVGGELMYFTDYLKINGVVEAENWIIYSVNNVTPDGKTFIGAGTIDGTECSFVLTIDGMACEGPTNLTYTIEESNYNDIVLTWDAPANPVDVTYDIYTSFSENPVVSGLEETTYTFENMDAGEYQFFVRANWRGGECISEISNMVRPTVYSCANEDKCELKIVAVDYFGDGWDNGYISIVGSMSDIEYTAKLTTGGALSNPDTITLQLCPDTYQFTWIPGNWDEENGFTILFDDEVIFEAEINSINETFNYSFLEYQLDCGTGLPTAEPTNLIATPESTSAIALTWDAVENATAYNIYKDNEKVATVEQTSYTVENLEYDTEYCFYVTSLNGNVESNKSEVVCIKTLGESVTELNSSLRIYPNPVNDKLIIETTENVESISIYTITGVKVYNQQPTANSQQQIDVTGFNAGVYFVKVRTENGEMVKRFVKK